MSTLTPHFKVRIWMRRAGVIHTASATEPQIQLSGNQVVSVAMDALEDTELGDVLGFIDWAEVSAVTWRYAGLEPSNE